MRYGKPIKNKRRRDPRYFLNESVDLQEDMGMLKKVCDNKMIIISAIKEGKLSDAVWLGAKLGLVPRQVKDVHDLILTLSGYDSIDELMQDTNSADMVAAGLDKGCVALDALPDKLPWP